MTSSPFVNGETRAVVPPTSTYLLAWNPEKYAWEDLDDGIKEIGETGGYETLWSSGNTRNMPAGSRFYLLRVGQEPKGLVGSGTILEEPREGQHWDLEKNARGEKTLRVRIRFERLARMPFVRRNELNAEPFNVMHWDIQSPGVRINEAVVQPLALLWTERRNAPTPAMIAGSAPVVRRWRSRWQAAQHDEAWLERHRLRDTKRREVVPAIRELIHGFVNGRLSLEEFRDIFHRRTMNEWDLFGLKGAGAMLLNTLAKNLPDSDELRAQLIRCLAVPADEAAARRQLENCTAYLDEQIAAGVATKGRIGPKRIGFLASACWHMFDIEEWPPLYPSARKALEADGLLGEASTAADGYIEFRQVFSALARALGLSSWDFEHLCDWETQTIDVEPPGGGSVPVDPPAHQRVWLVAPGPAASEWERFVREGIIAIGWDYLGDLTQYADSEALRIAIREHEGATRNPTHDALACQQFVREMEVGDAIFAKRGRYDIVGYGVITSEYRHEPERGEYAHVRSVNWKLSGSWPRKKPLVTKTLTEIGQDAQLVADLHGMLGVRGSILAPPPIPPILTTYELSDALKEVFLTETDLVETLELLRYKKNLVLQGPPGVGKTFIAKRLAHLLLGAQDKERITQVQFHQSYSYEDFIQGYRPGDKGQFARADGPFLRFCEQALQDPAVPYVIIIDEINRGNLSKIFGELLLLIEADKRTPGWATTLTYSTEGERFYVPSNLHIIGTMNTADRSLALVDYALRRRFAFVSIDPAFDHPLFADSLSQLGASPELVTRLTQRIGALNLRLRQDPNLGDGFCIGHSYFCHAAEGREADSAWYERIIRTEVAPLLREYWFDNRERADEEASRLLGNG